MKRLSIVTDAWSPQVNGVVVTLESTVAELARLGYDVDVVSPEGFTTMPMPSYPEIPLALLPGRQVARRIDAFTPDDVHIATEGPLGLAARRHCLRTGQPFTTAYHTQFPEYIHARCRLPSAWSYAWLRRFHAPSSAVMCATRSIAQRLVAHGFANVVHWSRGVDSTLFRPAHSALLPSLCRTGHELASANVVRGLLDSAATLVGPLLAAVLLELTNAAVVFAVAAGASLWAAALLLRLKYDAPPRPARPRRSPS